VRHSLFKYYTETKYAEALLNGEIFFQSFGYFRDYEDNSTRGDEFEGTSVYRPAEGLSITNQTQGTRFVLPEWRFEATANQEDILIFCASRSLTAELWKRFEAAACVEVLKISTLCKRIKESLSAEHILCAKRVTYYKATDSCNPRWALPDEIATSKLENYDWQNEYRFVIAPPSALEFEKAQYQLTRRVAKEPRNLSSHRHRLLKTRSLADICRLHLRCPI